jgi:hypothetical protein
MSDAVEAVPDDPVAAVRRWLSAGGRLRVVSHTDTHVELALLTCDLGEEVGRVASDDPALLHYITDLPDQP